LHLAQFLFVASVFKPTALGFQPKVQSNRKVEKRSVFAPQTPESVSNHITSPQGKLSGIKKYSIFLDISSL